MNNLRQVKASSLFIVCFEEIKSTKIYFINASVLIL